MKNQLAKCLQSELARLSLLYKSERLPERLLWNEISCYLSPIIMRSVFLSSWIGSCLLWTMGLKADSKHSFRKARHQSHSLCESYLTTWEMHRIGFQELNPKQRMQALRGPSSSLLDNFLFWLLSCSKSPCRQRRDWFCGTLVCIL